MFILRLILLLALVLAAFLILAGQFGLLQGKAPSNIGVTDGKLLRPPSKTENSVSSQASLHPDHPMRTYADIAPIRYTGDSTVAWARLQKAVASLPRTTIITSSDGYLYAQCTTLVLRFTDDVEFSLDPANNVIHTISSSRLGRKDFGVNRKRIEAVRAAFNAI